MNKRYGVKNLVALVLVFASLVILFAGCSNAKSPETTEPTEKVQVQVQVPETTPVETVESNGVYSITILPTSHGTVKADRAEAKEGELIKLTVEAEGGYVLNSLTVNGQKCTGSFRMPARNVSVLARFALDEETEKPEDEVVYPIGDFFGTFGRFLCSPALDMRTDTGKNPYLIMDAKKATPLYTYVKCLNEQRFYVEMTVQVTGIRGDEKYPKIGLMMNDTREMVKFYLDMNTDKQVGTVGAVRQYAGWEDDWAGQSTWQLPKKLDLSSGKVKLGLLRDKENFYYYINGQLVATGSNLSDRQAAAGFFTFGTSVKLTKYLRVDPGKELNEMLEKARKDAVVFNNAVLTENFFTNKDNGAYSLSTNSDAGHLVDDVMIAGHVMREGSYSLKGKLTLSNAGNWGQSRILVSNDAKNEYFIALEKTDGNAYQIFTMSKANEENWENWQLIEPVGRNGNRNSLAFEIVVAGDQLYFLVDDQIYYTSDRVNMTESTVKFTGCNNATTTVEDLALTVYESAAEAKAYAESKANRFGDTFGVSQGDYWTTNGFDLSKDNGSNATVKCTAGAPQYAYLNDVFTDKFVFEASFNVEKVLNNDGYPKFGLLVNGSSEMVKFFMDMTPAMTADKVGVVYQPTGGGDDWGGSVSCDVPGMSFTGSDTVKMKLVRDGRAYYLYVNDELVLHNAEGFKAEKGAVGIFSFNAVMTASKYSYAVDGVADSAIQKAKDDVVAKNKLGLSTNYFTEVEEDKYTLTTNADVGHMVDDVIKDSKTVRTAYYSLKGKLTLSDAGNWGQSRILVSNDAKNEYVIALEKTDGNAYQIFTMSKANEENWENWQLIEPVGRNGNRNSLDFEIVVAGDQLYFLVDDQIYYTSDRVNMTESTVKFTGCNNATTTVEDLALTVYESAAEAKAYAQSKANRFGDTFGVSQGNYWTTNGFDLSKDNGSNATVKCTAGAPQYAYLNDVYTDKFVLEASFNVEKVLNNDEYPKFGLLVNGSSEMVKFFMDMTPAMTADKVGVVYQPTGGGDDWGGSISCDVPGMSFTGSDTVKMKLVRDGRAYYLYVNDELVLHNAEGFKAEKGAVGIFSFNAVMTASKYSYAVDGAADSAIQKAKEDLDAREEVPGTAAPKQMLQSNNQGKIDFVELGKKIWTDKDYVFISMPEAFVGKEFVKASYGAENQTVDVTVQKSGYVYVLTNTYKTSNSQAETLDGMNYTKLDMAGWKFCDFTGTSSYIWVYEKYVEAGETLKLGQWSVVIASESRLNLDSDSSKAADSSMAVLKPAEGASVGNMELGAKAFADKDYTFTEMPYWLAGKNYILGNYGKGSATAVRGGYVYMLTNTGNSGKRVSYLESNGYTKVNVPAFTAFTGGNFGDYEFVVYRKSVAENETVSWPSWAVPVFSGDLVLADNLAKLTPDYNTTVAAKYDQDVRLFDNRTYYASGDRLEALHGKSYLHSGFEEGATGTVTKAGTVYVQIPVRNSNASYKQLEADLIAAGYTPVPYRLFRNNKGLPGKSLGYAQKLYQKEVEVGETVHFGQYNLVYFDTLSEEEYYVMPSVTIPAYIINNPKVYGPSDDLYTYDPSDRNWQGCPVITTTKGPNGGTRMWAAWFTGGEDELGKGNMAVLLYSDDNGQTWVDPAVAIVHPDVTASVTKPQLWTLDDGTLWVSWTQHTVVGNAVGFDGRMGTWAAVCKNPWASMDEWQWTTPTRLFEGRGNGKITVLNRGLANEEWLTTAFDWIDRNYSKVYSSTDRGQTWTFKGKAEVTGSTYNNAILTERRDANGNSYLWMLLRQLSGNMKESFSYDGGVTWTNATVSNIAHPNSAIYVGWTSSGNLLMINHKDFNGRNNLTAFLSYDGGRTWPHTLLLDARSGVSYPDVIESNGSLYIVYDYDRFNTGRMYMAKITEADIVAGQLVSSGSYLKHQFSSMGIHGPQVNEGVQKINLSGMEATASSTGSPAWDAFDSNADTRWCATNETVPQWLMIDLKNVYDLDAVYMFFEQKSNWDYKVEVSVDGNEWNVYSDPAAQKIIDVTINQQAKARYVRLTVESTTGGAWASVWEMELYGKLAEPEVSEELQKINLSGMEATASSTGSPAWDAFDGNAGTRWCATDAAVPQWLMIDLKAVYDLDAVKIIFEQESDWNYKVEVSVDGNEWNVYSDPDAQKLSDVTINQQAKARYVRLTVESTTGGAWASVWEMELYGKLAEPEVSEELQKINLSGMEATASSTGSPAWDAFDGNAGTRWCATDAAVPQWLMIDLKAVYDLDAVKIIFEQESDWNYKVEVSLDGNEWSVYSDPDAQKLSDVTINQQAKARYVRLTVESTTSGAWASVWEMELYGKLAEPEVSEELQKINLSGMEATASSTGSPAWDAFDGNAGTRWCATDAAVPQWLMIDLKAVYDLDAVKIIFEQESDWNYKVEVSLDGNEWSVYSDPDAQKLSDVTINQQAKARYVRLTVESTTGGAWASVWEMELYGKLAEPEIAMTDDLDPNPNPDRDPDPEPDPDPDPEPDPDPNPEPDPDPNPDPDPDPVAEGE